MLRLFILLFAILIAVIGITWYSSQTLPSWYQQDVSQQEKLVEQLSQEINSQGIASFFGNKFTDVLGGQLQLSEVEFNALLLASLQSSQDGRRVLSVSEAIRAQLSDDKLEIGAVVDLTKVAKLSEQASEAVAQLNKALPLLDQSKLFLSISGLPVARNGEIGFNDNFSVKIGAIPISSKLLAQMGVPVHKATQSSVALSYVSVKSLSLANGQIVLTVQPKFSGL